MIVLSLWLSCMKYLTRVVLSCCGGGGSWKAHSWVATDRDLVDVVGGLATVFLTYLCSDGRLIGLDRFTRSKCGHQRTCDLAG